MRSAIVGVSTLQEKLSKEVVEPLRRELAFASVRQEELATGARAGEAATERHSVALHDALESALRESHEEPSRRTVHEQPG